MTSGPDHYREAQELLVGQVRAERGSAEEMSVLAEAQVHALLALAAATALGTDGLPARDWDAWRQAVATHPPSVAELGLTWCEPRRHGIDHPHAPLGPGQECSCTCHELTEGQRTLPGHPVRHGAGYECCCGAAWRCQPAAPRSRTRTTSPSPATSTRVRSAMTRAA